MNIWRQFNLANPSFLGDWRILYYCILHSLGNKDNLAKFNLADIRNSPNRQNKFYAKFSSCMVYKLAPYTWPFHKNEFYINQL